jgi:hypothetical protein
MKKIVGVILINIIYFNLAWSQSIVIPTPLSAFSYQLQGKAKTFNGVKYYFLDLFDTSASTISDFKTKGLKVICYFSAGSSEDWRPDYKSIPQSAMGKKLDDWPGEKWLDIRQGGVLNVMKKRLALAKEKGCYGVDPDNVDGYGNNTGFSIQKKDSINYLKSLTDEAHRLGLAIGLKNAPEIVSSLASYMDWSVVEECQVYKECSSYSAFVKNNKAVFRIEYKKFNSSWCSTAKKDKMSLIFANYDLDGNHKSCPN